MKSKMTDDLKFSSPEAWRARATELFGDDELDWTFECPMCKHKTTVRDWRDAGAPLDSVAFSCVGRWTKAGEFKAGDKGPCTYAGGGLFKLNPVSVEGMDDRSFAFAGPEQEVR